MPHHRTPANHDEATVSPVDVERALKGASYPATKDQLVAYARRRQTPANIMGGIESMPGDRYESETDVTTAFSRAQSQGKNKSMK
jgi:hypothetical protein